MQVQSDFNPSTLGHLTWVRQNDPYTDVYHCTICKGEVTVAYEELRHGLYAKNFGAAPCRP